MKRLSAQLAQLADENREIAKRICQTADAIAQGITPRVLQEIETAIWIDLSATERRLRTLAWREQRRKSKLRNPRFAKSAAFRAVRGEQIQLLARRQELLRDRRNLFRQLGDLCAWVALRFEPMIIRPLAARRTHALPSGVGAEGIIEATTKAHESERFLVLANDLTRCLGIGDITVVRADSNWQLPVSYEVKSHADSEKSTRILIDVHRATRVGSAEEALALDFETMLGAVDAPFDDRRPSKKAEKQLSQLMERSKLVDNISRQSLESTRPMRRFRWKAIANVLEKALTTGMSFDSLERGVVYVGMRNSFGPESETAMRRLHRRLLDFGFGSRLSHLTSADFAVTDSFAAVIPPIAMWPLSFNHRMRLLSGDLFYACLLDPASWNDAFAERGIYWRADGRRWLLQVADQKVMFNRFDVVRIEIGVYFAAVSPREVAAAVADLLSRRTM